MMIGDQQQVVEEGGVAGRLWSKCRRQGLWAFAKYTPFFVCLASGTLHPDAFLRCIPQDVHFLNAFVQAYGLAKECADDEEDKIAIHKLRKSIKYRLQNLSTTIREWGFELPEESTPETATVKYTDFLLATAAGKVEGEKVPGNLATPFERTKVAAYTLAAITPWMRFHASICKEIDGVLEPDVNGHKYQKWIDCYCSQDFEELALQTEDVLDKLSISLTSEELEIIEKLYLQAMKLQVDFFSTQLILQQIIVPLRQVLDPADCHLIIVCDFDMTCTTVDSSAVLAEIAIITAPKVDSNGPEVQLARMSSADLRNTWGVLSTQYVEEYDQCIESILADEKVGGFDYEGLGKALEQLGEFEKMANCRVIESGVLKGLNLEDIKRAGQHLSFQGGCRRFFQNIVKNENLKADVHILSYCWCGDLIRSSFSGDLNDLRIHSNELEYEESISTGEIAKMVESPMEKLQAFDYILNNCSTGAQHKTVYIGGSVGDFLCLLKADIGVVIGSSPSLRRLGARFGISFVPLFSGVVKQQKEFAEGSSSYWKKLPGNLYTVSSWAEIHAFILGSI